MSPAPQPAPFQAQDDPIEFGLAIRHRREQLGLTQTELGRRVGLDQSYIARIENGKRKVLQARRREQLSAALGLPEHRATQGPASQDWNGESLRVLARLLSMARLARASGYAAEAAEAAATVAHALPGRDLDRGLAVIRADALLVEGVALGDLVARRDAALPVARLTQAYELASTAGAERLAHEAALKLGNELRKGGHAVQGVRWSRRAVDEAPDRAAQEAARITLVRSLAELQKADEMMDEIRILRDVENDDEIWTPTLHPRIAIEVEVRGRLTVGAPVAPELIELLAAPIGSARLAPQWDAIIALTRAQALMAHRRDDEAVSALLIGLTASREMKLAKQEDRARQLIDANRSRHAEALRDNDYRT